MSGTAVSGGAMTAQSDIAFHTHPSSLTHCHIGRQGQDEPGFWYRLLSRHQFTIPSRDTMDP